MGEWLTKIFDPEPDPTATLLQYIRRKLNLPGTKEGCGQGGCGACTVMISKYDTNQDRVFAVNSCIFPLCAVHGLAVTTVEGVGNPKTGLHAVQKRLIESHGLQCGFCTPGFVMSAFTLLRNNPQPSREQIEKALEGNLCRCTGYRPIVDALVTFSKETCPMGDACCKNKSRAEIKDDCCDLNTTTDTMQVPIFPPELKLNPVYHNQLVQFSDGGFTWYRPTTLQDLLTLKSKYLSAPIVQGNTSIAWWLKQGNYNKEKVLIYGRDVPELKAVSVTDTGVMFGAALTVIEFKEHLLQIEAEITPDKRQHFPSLIEMATRFGIDQIRNVSTLGGSVICGRSNSDVLVMLTAVNPFVTIVSSKHERTSALVGLQLEPDEVMKAIFIPFSKKMEYSAFCKQAERRSFSLAVINGGIVMKLNTQHRIEELRLCYGGVTKGILTAEKASHVAAGQSLDEKLIHNVLTALTVDFNVKNGNKDDSYKRAVAAAFWFKFANKVLNEIGSNAMDSDPSLTRPVALPPYHSSQVYNACTNADQSPQDPVGHNIANIHAEAAVTGDAIFVDDIPHQQGELHVALVLSTKAHARIRHVDTSKALELKGVHSYIDHTSIPGMNLFGAIMPDQELFATDLVQCYGQPIGGIIAESREIAHMASELVVVDYEELKPILTIEDAISTNSYFGSPLVLSDGDVEKGFSDSDHVIEGEFSTGLQEHFYMEPFATLVIPKENNELEVMCSCQNICGMQASLSKLLNLPMNKITCRLKRIGGAFGGKETMVIICSGPAAIAAQITKRAVRCVFPRATDMLITGKRHPFLGVYKVGFSKDGTITTLDVEMFSNGGFSLDMSTLVMEHAMIAVNSVYNIPNIRLKGMVCKTHTPSNTAMRGFGQPQGVLIMEDAIFKVSNFLNKTPAEIREKNLCKSGDKTPYGHLLEHCTVKDLWRQCMDESKYNMRIHEVKKFNKENRWKKRGLSVLAIKFGVGFGPMFLNQGAALVNIYGDGTVLVAHGAAEMGQGVNTKLLQLAAHTLGVPMDKVHTNETSTQTVPNSVVTGGSMGTDIYGPAVMNACQTLNERLKPLREKMQDKPWEELITAAFFSRIQLSATGYFRIPKEGNFDMEKKTGKSSNYYTYGAVCTEVEIDVLTGENQVLQADIVMDVGKSLNPGIDIGQIEGAFVQGMGMVTCERMDIDEKGLITNCSPLLYKIPHLRSIPRKFNVTLMKNHNISTVVYSSKGIGEPPYLLSVSVLDAIKDAVKAARTDIGLEGYFRLDSPATIHCIQAACGNQIKY